MPHSNRIFRPGFEEMMRRKIKWGIIIIVIIIAIIIAPNYRSISVGSHAVWVCPSAARVEGRSSYNSSNHSHAQLHLRCFYGRF